MPLVRTFALLAALAALAACNGSGSGPAGSPGTTAQLPSGTVSFKNNVAPLLAQTCAGCHTAGGQGSEDIVFFDDAGNVTYGDVKSGIRRIMRQVQSGAMPKGGTPLTAAQIGVLQAWSNAGAPNN